MLSEVWKLRETIGAVNCFQVSCWLIQKTALFPNDWLLILTRLPISTETRKMLKSQTRGESTVETILDILKITRGKKPHICRVSQGLIWKLEMLIEHLINILYFNVFFSTSKIFWGLPLNQLNKNTKMQSINHQLCLPGIKHLGIVNISGKQQMPGSIQMKHLEEVWHIGDVEGGSESQAARLELHLSHVPWSRMLSHCVIKTTLPHT